MYIYIYIYIYNYDNCLLSLFALPCGVLNASKRFRKQLTQIVQSFEKHPSLYSSNKCTCTATHDYDCDILTTVNSTQETAVQVEKIAYTKLHRVSSKHYLYSYCPWCKRAWGSLLCTMTVHVTLQIGQKHSVFLLWTKIKFNKKPTLIKTKCSFRWIRL